MPASMNGKRTAKAPRLTAASVQPGETLVFTDGACLGNPGPGGWAWAVPDGPYASGAAPATTNQRMEITAALRALQSLEGPVLVISDSTYVVDCFRDRWWEGWRRRGWRNAAGNPVANRDLWEPMLEIALDGVRPVRFGWVKGHSGDAMNDRVDLLATSAAATQQGVSGAAFSI
ncbi:MAG: ribonuclease H family protein [Acidimicrobiales bacterium]